MNWPIKLPCFTASSYQQILPESSQKREVLDEEACLATPSPRSRSICWPLTVFLLFTIVVVQACLLWKRSGKVIDTSILLDTPVPDFSKQISAFLDDSGFKNLSSKDDVDAAWSAVIEPHGGFVHVQQPERYGLKPNQGIVAGTSDVYMVSFYHQLHCLQRLQREYVQLYHGEATRPHEIDPVHAEHCFSYVRQGIMCSADTTLEGPDESPQPGESLLRGWGIEHTCRSWAAIDAWMRGNVAVKEV